VYNDHTPCICRCSLAPLVKMQEELSGDGIIPGSALSLRHVTTMQKLHDAHRQYWLVDNAHKFAPASFRLLSCHSAILDCGNSYAQSVIVPSDSNRDQWISSGLLALHHLAEVSKRSDLEYWCVAAFTHISRFGTMVFAVSPVEIVSWHIYLTWAD